MPRGSAPAASGGRAQLLHRRSDLELLNIRGNVETRLRKLDAGEYDAIVQPQAGLHRLGFADRISLVLQPPEMLPAVGQAAIGIECRADDAPLIALLGRISDPIARAEVALERACPATLRAGCRAPVGVWARVEDEQLVADGIVLSPTENSASPLLSPVRPPIRPRSAGSWPVN
ncbi:MAG: hypothetical protein U0992_00815 [Planctomycetaceae bacterium]